MREVEEGNCEQCNGNYKLQKQTVREKQGESQNPGLKSLASNLHRLVAYAGHGEGSTIEDHNRYNAARRAV